MKLFPFDNFPSSVFVMVVVGVVVGVDVVVVNVDVVEGSVVVSKESNV